MQRKTPASYRDADWRCVLTAEESGVGIGFDRKDREPILFFLSIESARRFCDALRNSLDGLSAEEPTKAIGYIMNNPPVFSVEPAEKKTCEYRMLAPEDRTVRVEVAPSGKLVFIAEFCEKDGRRHSYTLPRLMLTCDTNIDDIERLVDEMIVKESRQENNLSCAVPGAESPQLSTGDRISGPNDPADIACVPEKYLEIVFKNGDREYVLLSEYKRIAVKENTVLLFSGVCRVVEKNDVANIDDIVRVLKSAQSH